jgi:thioredoxin 1
LAIELNRDNYDSETLKSEEPVLVDFWGPQCRPCLALTPVVEDLEKNYAGKLKIARVDASQNRMLCSRLRVMSLPTFILYRDRSEDNRLVGEDITRNDLEAAVQALLAKETAR